MAYDLRNLQTNYQLHSCPCYYIPFLVRVYVPMLWVIPGRKGMLVGKFKLNPRGGPMWVWLKLKLTVKGDFCEVSVTAFCKFLYAQPQAYIVTFRPKHPKWDQNLQTTSTCVTFVWESPREANHHLFHLIFRKVNDYRPLRVLALLPSGQTSIGDRFHGEK